MDTSVILLGFFGAVAVFTIGLVVLLREERHRTAAHAQHALEVAQSRRDATLTARAEPSSPFEMHDAVEMDDAVEEVDAVAAVAEMPLVRPGSFCQVPGSVGRSSRGTLLVCSSIPRARPRWREARRLSRAG